MFVAMQSQAVKVIEKFESMAALARALGHNNPTTVQKWKVSGFIPPKYHMKIMEVSEELGAGVTAYDFLTVPLPEDADHTNGSAPPNA